MDGGRGLRSRRRARGVPLDGAARAAGARVLVGSGGGPAAPPPRFIELWGKFGLLNNRLRCLANALAFAARVDATVVLSGSWELFAEAVLDTERAAA